MLFTSFKLLSASKSPPPDAVALTQLVPFHVRPCPITGVVIVTSLSVLIPVLFICVRTQAVVANRVLLSPLGGVGAVGAPVSAALLIGARVARPGTVGAVAVPPKSPVSLIVPSTLAVAGPGNRVLRLMRYGVTIPLRISTITIESPVIMLGSNGNASAVS